MPVSLGTNNHWECYSIFIALPPLWQERRARQERARRAGGERKEKGRMKVIWYRIEMCLANSECVAWSFGIPLCGGSTAPLCWLKGTSENSEENYCRISGIVAYLFILSRSLPLLLLIFLPSLSLAPSLPPSPALIVLFFHPAGSRFTPTPVKFTVYEGTNVVATGAGLSGVETKISILLSLLLL